MKITLPFPDSRLYPNRKSDRWTKAAITRDCRNMVAMIANDWMYQEGVFSMVTRCKLTYTFYSKTRKIADCDSLVRACKPFIDGLVDAQLLKNDSWDVIIERTQRRGKPDRLNPRTEIEIEAL